MYNQSLFSAFWSYGGKTLGGGVPPAPGMDRVNPLKNKEITKTFLFLAVATDKNNDYDVIVSNLR